jgi:aspartate/tyrosine/aromatic aminotransferase
MCAKIAVNHLIKFDALTEEQKNELNKMNQNLKKRRDDLNEAIKTIEAKLRSPSR